MTSRARIAAALPLVLLVLLASLAWPLLSPFAALWGWPRVAVVSVLCAAPLATGCVRAAGSVLPWIAAVALGIALLASVVVGPPHGFWSGQLLRSWVALAWALASVGWLLAARRTLEQTPARRSIAMSPLLGCLFLVAAVGLPALYALDLARRETTRAEEAIVAGRWPRALDTLQRLRALGSPLPVGALPLEPALAACQERLRDLEQRARMSPGEDPTDAERLAQAETLLGLERWSAALEIVQPCLDRSPPAALLAGYAWQQQSDWEAAARCYRRALALLARETSSPATIVACTRAYDALAFNLRELGRIDEAEALYAEAITKLPAAAAHFHYQRGLHYARYADRPAAAAREFASAAQLDPAFGASLAEPATEFGLPSCRWRPPEGASSY